MPTYEHKSLEQLSELLSIKDDSLLYLVEDPTTAPLPYKVTWGTIKSLVGLDFGSLNPNSGLDNAEDLVIIRDVSTGETVTATISQLIASGTGSATNLSIGAHDGSSLEILSSTGAPVVLPVATLTLSGLMSTADKQQLALNTANIAALDPNAEQNVQSDWNQADSSADDFIKNKPVIPSSIDDLSNVDLTGITNGQVLKWNGTTFVAANDDNSGGGAGEVNTVSNVGAGQDIFKQKIGVNFEFRGLASVDNKLSLNINNDNIEFTINEANLDLGNMGGTLDDSSIPATIARDTELHDAVTVTGTPNYITLSGQVLTLGQIDTDDLINGSSTPGNSRYFGTDAAGNKGFFPVSTGGENNTASNVGTGVDVFKQKLGVDLEFRGISPASNKVTAILNGDNIDLDIDEANLSLSSIGGEITTDQLPNGVAAPAADQYYGTNNAGTLGFFGLPAGNTDLGQGTHNGTSLEVTSSTGNNTTLPIATGTLAGLMSAADKTKSDFITVTQAVDLDQMETDIAALANGMIYRGDWDASAGTFPPGADTGHFYYVAVGGTVDGVTFDVGDNIVATTDGASTTTFASNWSKHDQTDAVQSVAGLTGSITVSSLLTALGVDPNAEANTASNVGGGGEGFFKQKTGVDLEFKKLDVASNKLSLDSSVDAVFLNVVEGNLDISNMGGQIIGSQISDNAVDNTKLADMAGFTIKGNDGFGAGDPKDLTAAEVRALLNVQELPAQVSTAEKVAGNELALRSYAPQDIHDMIDAHGGGATLFDTNLTQTANRTHDQATFNQTINNSGLWKFINGSNVTDLRAGNILVGTTATGSTITNSNVTVRSGNTFDIQNALLKQKIFTGTGSIFYENFFNASQSVNLTNSMGSADPEGVETASPGSQFRNWANGKIFRKDSGTGNTGWVEIGAPGENIITNDLTQTANRVHNIGGFIQEFQNVNAWEIGGTASGRFMRWSNADGLSINTSISTSPVLLLNRDGDDDVWMRFSTDTENWGAGYDQSENGVVISDGATLNPATGISITSAGVKLFDNYTLPNVDGTDSQVLKTDGSGVVTWQNDIPTRHVTRQVLADAATINWDGASGHIASVTLEGNRILAVPTNLVDGTYELRVSQDAAGGRTLLLAAGYKTPGGNQFTLSTDPNALDILSITVQNGVVCVVSVLNFLDV